ncbi:MAG: hypothetical protein E3J29_06670 [Dehalococcoidia bacterium]|nr:MAG: hypothetical protein E3J29_06670 [Dehalococcoidia bacterium]
MKLIYIGDPKWIRGVEGWPACDHDEPDEALSAAKLASRLYRSESGKEQTERRAREKVAKKAANKKAAQDAAMRATEAGTEAAEAIEKAKRLANLADAARRTAR